MGKLILIRHGETDKNIGNQLHGRSDIEKLNPKGREQINKVSNKLKEYLPFRLYCSKELRAIESAKIIEKELPIQGEEIDGLEERNWGIYTGKPWSDVKAILDKLTLDERYLYVPENGESWKEFESRLINVVEKVIKSNDGSNIVLVTHGGAIRALMPYLLGVSREESFKYDPANASMTIFDYNDGVYKPLVVDDTSHLAAE